MHVVHQQVNDRLLLYTGKATDLARLYGPRPTELADQRNEVDDQELTRLEGTAGCQPDCLNCGTQQYDPKATGALEA